LDLDDGQHHSIEEVKQAFRELPLAYWVRLRRWTVWKLAGNSTASADDVINDMWLRFVNGSRRWPKGIPFATCFWNAVKSSINAEWEKHKRVASAQESLPEDGNGAETDEGTSPLDQLVQQPERRRQEGILDHIAQAFKIDRAVAAVLEGIDRQLSPLQVQEEFDLSETQYDSARRKLRRFLNKHYPNGWRPNE
jgi:RNA polymerase sigma-70 factor (ECF subfamily)